MQPSTSLLIVERIDTDEARRQVVAQLRVGGRREQVAIDMTRAPLIGYGHTPDALQHHVAAHESVVDLLLRSQRGESISLPWT